MVVEAKKDSIASVMTDFQAKGERWAAMEGCLPRATLFFVEATLDLLVTNIPQHRLTPFFAIMIVEQWAANSTSAHDFSNHIWAWGEAKDATAPRLWSGMVGMMTEIGMEWSAAIYRATNKLYVALNGEHNADALELGTVGMAQQLLIKRTGPRTPLGNGDGDNPMCDSLAA